MTREGAMSETRKIAAILVADVVGYSRLAGADEDRTLSRLRGLRSDLIDPAVAAHRGRVVKRTGDGILIEFRSVVDAVRCAIEVQNGLIERNAGVPAERRIEFRVGIHLGDVVEEADVLGETDCARPGDPLEARGYIDAVAHEVAAYRQVKARLDLAVTDLGPTQLKNIAEPIRVYSLEVGKPSQARPTPPPPASQKTGPPRLSIVVLPFKTLSSDPGQDYFADGVTENLTTDLSRIRNSFVIARNTAFTFKGKAIDAREIGKELGVRYLLEGSVQRDQNRVRVNAQLIDAESGAHLWADRFEEDLADVFKLQDQIVARLGNALGFELVKAEAERAARSKSPDAIDLTMRGLAFVQQNRTQLIKDKNIAALALFEQALKIDPNAPDALAGEAECYLYEHLYWNDPQTDYDVKVIGQADRAIALAADNVWAYYVKSAYLSLSRRFDEALRTANAGLAINPNYASLYYVRANAKSSLGQFEQAKPDVKQAMRLSPRDPRIGVFHMVSGDAELGLGHFDAAIDEYRNATDSGFRPFTAYTNLAAAYALKGKMDEAKTALAEARRLNPKLTVKWMIAHTPNLPPVFEGLRKAGLPEE
jgi:adenylate cyclase